MGPLASAWGSCDPNRFRHGSDNAYIIVHELWTRLLLTLIAAGCIAMVVFLYFASQRTERSQLEQNIERYRRGDSLSVR
jgi:hypothetical protein